MDPFFNLENPGPKTVFDIVNRAVVKVCLCEKRIGG